MGLFFRLPKLPEYAKKRVDDMRLREHFDNYVHPKAPRNYQVVCINYAKAWDDVDAVVAALGLPASAAAAFPPRNEFKRDDKSAAAEGNEAHSSATQKALQEMYRELREEMFAMPAVTIA